MSENIFSNKSLGTFNKPFGFNIFPERTMQQVKQSAVNLLKDVIKPVTDIGFKDPELLDGTIEKKIEYYQNLTNFISATISNADKNAYRSLDVKS